MRQMVLDDFENQIRPEIHYKSALFFYPLKRHLYFTAISFKNNKQCMTIYENRLLADDSHKISYLIFCRKLGKMLQNLPSAAVVIGALRISGLILVLLVSTLFE